MNTSQQSSFQTGIVRILSINGDKLFLEAVNHVDSVVHPGTATAPDLTGLSDHLDLVIAW